MLSPDYLRRITERTEQKVAEVNEYLIDKIVKRIVRLFEETGEIKLIPSSLLDIKKQQNAGKLLEEIQGEVEKRLPDIKNEVRRAFHDAGAKIADDVNATTGQILHAEQEKGNLSDVEMPQFESRQKAIRISELNMTDKEISCLESAYRRTEGEIYNLTKTTASQAQKAFIEACDAAYFKATHGTSLDTAIADAIKEVSAKGMTVIHYKSGHEDKIEVAIARAVRTGVNQANGDITLTRCAEAGVNYVVASSHIGARVTPYADYRTHADWQGKVYSLDWDNPVLSKYTPQAHEQPKGEFSFLNRMREFFQKQKNKKYKDFIETCGYGKMLGICGINCRHSYGLFYPGISINNQKQYDSEENKKRYQVEQRQRAMERAIRKTKRELNALDNSGLENEEVNTRRRELKQLLYNQDDAYQEYCRKNRLNPLNYRLQIAKTYGINNSVNKIFEYQYKGNAKFSSGESMSQYMDQLNNALSESVGNPIMISNLRNMMCYEWEADKNIGSFMYNPTEDKLLYNPDVHLPDFNMNSVLIHEFTHKIDVTVYKSWENESFINAIKRTREYIIQNEQLFAGALEIDGRYYANGEINDIIAAITEGRITTMFSHETEYWNCITVASEIFANISVLDVLNLDGKNEFDGFLNLIYDAYIQMVEG